MMRSNWLRHSLMSTLLLSGFAALGLCAHAQKSTKRESTITPLQQGAISVLDSTIDELNGIEDVQIRVALAENIIKLLAKKRPERCRQLLDTLFSDALQLKASSPDSSTQSTDPNTVVRKIIQLAASLDRKLAESYIRRYAGEEDSGNSDARSTIRALPLASNLYLKLARELIETNPSLAALVAGNSLRGPLTTETLIFIMELRRKDARQANIFFQSALQSVVLHQAFDINELSLLYSYVFSPTRVPYFTPQGLGLQQIADYAGGAQAYPIEPDLARQYLQASARVLLNPDRYTANAGRLTVGATGDLSFIKLIEPYVTAYQPTLAEPLSTQQAFLAYNLDPAQRTRLQTDTNNWNNTQNRIEQRAEASSDNIESILRQASETSDPKQRDQIYYMAATTAIQYKRYDAALEIIDQLSSESRDAAKPFIMFSIAMRNIKDKRLDEAEQWAKRDSDLTRRANLLTLIAVSSLDDKNKDTVRARALLNEATSIAAKLDNNREKISVLIGAASAYSRFDNALASELFRDVIGIANKIEDFTGDTKLKRRLMIGDFGYVYEMYSGGLTFEGLINQLALTDYSGVLADVRALKSRVPRLKAVIALCRAVLSKTS